MDKPRLTRTTPKMRVPRPGLPWRRIFAVFWALLLVAALVWAAQYCFTHALYNVSVAGTRVDGKTFSEIEHGVRGSVKKLKISLKDGAETSTPKLSEIGVEVDVRATAKKAFEARRGQQLLDDIQFWKTIEVPLQLEVDHAKLKDYLARTFPQSYIAPTPPSLKYNPGIEQFEVVPGKDGAGFDAPVIAFKVQEAAARPRKMDFFTGSKPVEPLVTDTTAVFTQDEANKRLRLRLDFLYKDKLVYFPEPHEIASWLAFRPNETTERLDIVYDKQKIASFLRTKVTDSLNNFFGGESAEPTETDEKLEITDINALAEDVIDALRANESMEKEIEAATVGSEPHEVAP